MNTTKILIFGAGRSSVYLIKLLQHYLITKDAQLTIVADEFKNFPSELKYNTHTFLLKNRITKALVDAEVFTNDIVVSLLPAHLHIEIARACLKFKKHLITASYVSKAMQAIHHDVVKENLIFLNEMGLDPGLDHISALHLIDRIKSDGGKINKYASHTGGLVEKLTPNNDTWNYKFTWNPKNVIVAGAQGAKFLEEGQIIELPYKSVFSSKKIIDLAGINYDSYPNRNSLNYQQKYGLETTSGIYRGTLRHKGFCDAWQVFVDLGMTDDMKSLQFEKTTSKAVFFKYFLDVNSRLSAVELCCEKLQIGSDNPIYKKIASVGLFDDSDNNFLKEGTAAEILLSILSTPWELQTSDIDIVVMKHEIEFTKENKRYLATSELLVKGENQVYTAMAKTVGLPLFEALKLMMNGEIKKVGVCTPTFDSIYKPLLSNLEKQGIVFSEKIIELPSVPHIA